jgi:hypothetical protein
MNTAALWTNHLGETNDREMLVNKLSYFNLTKKAMIESIIALLLKLLKSSVL